MPRKAARIRVRARNPACFNEAGAFMPRKAAEIVAADGLRIVGASMRPGLLCPGRLGEWLAVADGDATASMRPGLLCPGRDAEMQKRLGLSDSFNEAGAFMPRKVASNHNGLAAIGVASMRPGLLCPGRSPCRRGWWRRRRASMRPGLLCPGRLFTKLTEDPEGAASMRPGLLCPGRDAEMQKRLGLSDSFNEAGAFMPRKVASNHNGLAAIGVASMRPGLLCPGRSPCRRGWWRRRRASMRPGLLCPGRLFTKLTEDPEGAASMRPLLCPGRPATARSRAGREALQ